MFRELREPLSEWLRNVHGQGDWRAGWLGLFSATVSLVGMHVFGLSPLLAVFHVLLALVMDGIGPRIAVQWMRAQDAAARFPFVSPGHALAFARAVVAAIGGSGRLGSQGLVSTLVLPHAKSLDQLVPAIDETQAVSSARWLPATRWMTIGLIWFAIALFIGGAFILPIVQIAASLFDAYDWWGLALLLAINLMQLRSTWRELTTTVQGAPWYVGWLVEPPALNELIFWRQFKVFPLVLAMVVGFVLVISPGPLLRYYDDPIELAVALDAQLLGLVTGLFVILALLHALLLAAPRHSRRLIAVFNSIDVAKDPSSRRN